MAKTPIILEHDFGTQGVIMKAGSSKLEAGSREEVRR